VADIRVEKMAELLVNYSVTVKPGDKTAIMGDSAAEPLLKAIYSNVLKAGGYPYLISSPGGLDELFYKYASDDQLSMYRHPQN
jgi:aminopeptidase